MTQIIRAFCLFWVLNNTLNLSAQTHTNFDSLQTAIDRYQGIDTTKARMLISFSTEIRKTNQVKGIVAADQAIALAQRLNHPVLRAEAYTAKGRNLFNSGKGIEGIESIGQALDLYEGLQQHDEIVRTALLLGELSCWLADFEKAKQYLLIAEKSSKKTGDKIQLSKTYNQLAVAFMGLYQNTETLVYLNQAVAINQSIKYTAGLAANYNNLGHLYTNIANFKQALEYYQKAMVLNESMGIENEIAHNYNNISAIYFRLNDFSKSLEYDHKALAIYEKLNMAMQVGGAYVNMAAKYKGMREFHKALEYNEKGRAILEPIQAHQFLAICISNIGATYIDMHRYVDAFRYSEEALQLFEQMGLDAEIARVKISLGNIVIRASEADLQEMKVGVEDRTRVAEQYVLDGLNLSKEIGALYFEQSAHGLLSEIYENSGDYNKALTEFRYYIASRDSVSGEDIRQEITRKEIQFEFDKKETSLKFEQLLTEEQLQQQKLLTIQQQQSLRLKEQALSLSNKEKDLQRLAFLQEKAEKQDKEQLLILAEKDKQLQDAHLGSLMQEKALQLKNLAQKNALIGFLIAGLVAILLGFAAFYWWLSQKQAKKEAAAQASFTQQLLENMENDRGRVATDLHDSVSHDLLLLKQSIRKEISGPEVGNKIDNIINGIRQISRNMHPVMLDKIGLRLSLETLCEQFMQHETMYVSHEIQYNNTLSKSAELQIFRIVQEGLTNALKYAKAEAVMVQLQQSGQMLQLKIQDNGKGFDVQKVLDSGKAFGLNSIMQRAKVIRGKADIRSNETGTTIKISITPQH